MGTWLFVLLSISTTVVATTGAPLENSDRPCLSWDCRREMLRRNRVLNSFRAAESANKKSSVVEAEDKPCLSWDCRRKRRTVVAMPTDVIPEASADDTPCLTKDCRAGKRSNEDAYLMRKLRFDGTIPVSGYSIPETPADDTPCLTRDCRTGKRNNEDSSLKEKLRVARNIPEPQNDQEPDCLAWLCSKTG